MIRIIETARANCRDCYRCVRVCPIGAIRVENRQAHVDNELCVQCGTCVRECPQHAKQILKSVSRVKGWIEEGLSVAASIAPSFAAIYSGWRATRLPAALRRLGFSAVTETAEGAAKVAEASAGFQGEESIATCCPAVVSYIRKYKPELVNQLMPLVSPMVAHGRMLKARLGKDTKVVFIGPCAAKKGEALRPEYADVVDAVLTFAELEEWFQEENISLSTCLESGYETFGEPGNARLFPLEGGLLRAAGVSADAGAEDVLRISGAEEIKALLDTPTSAWSYTLVEPMFCRGGCIGGPCMPLEKDIFAATRDVVAYAKATLDLPGSSPEVNLATTWTAEPVMDLLPEISEKRIQEILETTGKADQGSQLNCGACGYKTCRENAMAVARGMAESGMCVSYMRQKAERRADKIIEKSPNGIVVVDSELNIVHMNERFIRMFNSAGNNIGRPVSHIVDPYGFEKLLAGAEGTQEAIHTRDGVKYHELIFMLPGEEELTGIYVDVSHSTFDAKQVDLIKDQSLRHARDLLAHQIRFSQEMAHYLGKSTAQTEELVQRLVGIYAEDLPG